MKVRLGPLGLAGGAHLLLRRALAPLPPGARLAVYGDDAALPAQLPAWCRSEGHRVVWPDPADRSPGSHRDGGPVAFVVRGVKQDLRWAGATRAGDAELGSVAQHPPARWGLAARGALIADGGPEPFFDLDDRDLVWTDVAPKLYAHAAARQWDPATAVAWDEPFTVTEDVESAVVQVMTYLVENEQVALVVPARFLGRVHPHFREVVQLLAIQVADEARHMELFNRRARLKGSMLGTSSAGGRTSLFTLMEESDFSLASFLLSVLGEGTFVNLLSFLVTHGPDPVTRRVAWLALQDERRHVLFGVAHLAHQATVDSRLLGRLRGAIERRHDALRDTAGLNADVMDSLVLIAAGSWEPAAIASGYAAVRDLELQMDTGRRRRLERLGFPADEAAALSALHTRNFM